MYVEINRNAGWPPTDEDLWVGGVWKRSQRHYSKMLNRINKHVTNDFEPSKILDFGCRCGRIMRHFDKSKEVWGTDTHEPAIQWCKENVDPELNFLTNSSEHSHLPFPDGYFDLIYAFSVFTHIGQNYLSWIMELKRILSKSGVMYITVHDEHTIEWAESFQKEDINHKFVSNSINSLREHLEQDYIVAFDGLNSFFQKEKLQKEMKKHFDTCNYLDKAYGYQSVLILSNA